MTKLIRVVQEKIKIKDLFKKLEIASEENAIKNIQFPLKVKTPYGYKNIKSAFRTEKQKTVTTYFGNNKTLKTSGKHRLKTNSNEWVYVDDLKVGDIIQTEESATKVISKKVGKTEILYDISVEDVHCYYSNGILSHNSWVLAKIGAEAMRQGKNVLHFTLELNENYVGLRYDACFTGIDFQNIKENVDIVKQKIKDIPGRLFIKYFPLKTVSPNSLKNHAERMAMLGNKPDMIIVDYADILKPFDMVRGSNSYQSAGDIYEELRSVAGSLSIPIWSASQCGRSSLEHDVIEAGSIADSYKKIMTCDFIMSLSRKTADKINDTARFHIMKNRFGPDGLTFPSKMRASCGDIEIYSPDSREGTQMQNLMNDGENSIKDSLRKKWNDMNSEED